MYPRRVFLSAAHTAAGPGLGTQRPCTSAGRSGVPAQPTCQPTCQPGPRVRGIRDLARHVAHPAVSRNPQHPHWIGSGCASSSKQSTQTNCSLQACLWRGTLCRSKPPARARTSSYGGTVPVVHSVHLSMHVCWSLVVRALARRARLRGRARRVASLSSASQQHRTCTNRTRTRRRALKK